MKLLVVSDNHGMTDILTELKQRYDGQVDAMIHCGDSELDADAEALEGFLAVSGNCDLDGRLPNERVFDIGDVKVLAVHGHLHRVNSSLMTVTYRAKELAADCVFFGHTHLLGAERIDDILFVNPGSISFPRGGNEKTYALVEKNEKSFIVSFFNENHEELTQLGREFPLQG